MGHGHGGGAADSEADRSVWVLAVGYEQNLGVLDFVVCDPNPRMGRVCLYCWRQS